MKITHISTPGHGYLSVNKDLIEKLGLIDKITSYSGMDANRVYLEEDCDATLFANTCKEQGINIEYKETYRENFNYTHNYNPKYFRIKEGDDVEWWNGDKERVEWVKGNKVKLRGYKAVGVIKFLRCVV